MTPPEFPYLPKPAPRRRRLWPWIAGLLLIVLVGIPGWRIFTLRRAEAELRASGFNIGHTNSAWEDLPSNPKLIFESSFWRDAFPARQTFIMFNKEFGGPDFRNLDAVAPALHRVQPSKLLIPGANALENVNALGGLKCLEELLLTDCPALENVDGIKGLNTLRWLHLRRCTKLHNMDVLKGLPILEILDLSGCRNIPASAVEELRAALPKAMINAPDEKPFSTE